MEVLVQSKEEKRAYDKLYHQRNKSKRNKQCRDNHSKNRERELVQMKEYREQNKEVIAIAKKEWTLNNRDNKRATQAKYRATKLKATPKWANIEAIKGWYKLAKMFDKTFKEKHHVDHIVPLQGKKVCGLHVEYNLQVLTAVENLSKGNKYVL